MLEALLHQDQLRKEIQITQQPVKRKKGREEPD